MFVPALVISQSAVGTFQYVPARIAPYHPGSSDSSQLNAVIESRQVFEL